MVSLSCFPFFPIELIFNHEPGPTSRTIIFISPPKAERDAETTEYVFPFSKMEDDVELPSLGLPERSLLEQHMELTAITVNSDTTTRTLASFIALTEPFL